MEETLFGNNLKYLIKSTKGLTQKDVADEIGASSASTISSYVTGGYPTVPSLIKISKLFKVSTDDLLFKDLRKSSKPKNKKGITIAVEFDEKETQEQDSLDNHKNMKMKIRELEFRLNKLEDLLK